MVSYQHPSGAVQHHWGTAGLGMQTNLVIISHPTPIDSRGCCQSSPDGGRSDEDVGPCCELLGHITCWGVKLSCEKGTTTEIFNRNVESLLLRRTGCAWLTCSVKAFTGINSLTTNVGQPNYGFVLTVTRTYGVKQVTGKPGHQNLGTRLWITPTKSGFSSQACGLWALWGMLSLSDQQDCARWVLLQRCLNLSKYHWGHTNK